MSIIMRVWLTLFLLRVLTSSSHASIPNSTIDSDVTEIHSLSETVKSSSPPIFHRLQAQVCEMINQCCPAIKTRLPDYVDGTVHGGSSLAEKCAGSYPPQSLLEKCPAVVEIRATVQDSDFLKYTNTISTVSRQIEIPSIVVPQLCSSDEAYATLCNWTEQSTIESCERKKVVYVAEHRSDDDYRTYVRVSKNNLRLMVSAINKAFPAENVIKTTTASTTVSTKKTTMQTTNTGTNSAQTAAWIFITLLTLLRFIFFCQN